MDYKIYYNSKLAKVLTFIKDFSTMMFFGVVITEKDTLSVKSKRHEECHVYQYRDCRLLGFYVFLLLLFLLLFLGVESFWLITLAIIPLVLFYVLYGIEFLLRWIFNGFDRDKAYLDISFEKHARWYASKYENKYTSFRFWCKNY